MSYFPRGVRWLLAINTGVFLLCYLGGSSVQSYVRVFLALSAEAAVRHLFIWQVFTYMFVHFGIMHWLFNMLFLWMVGMPVEQAWGMRRFLKFYLLCGLAAGICALLADLLVRDSVTFGASGAVMGLFVAFAILFPDATILVFLIFPMPAKYGVMIYVAVDLLMTLGGGNSGVSTVAHLGGAAFAYVYLKHGLPAVRLRLPDVRGAYRQWKLQRAKKKFQVYMRKHSGRDPWVN